MSDNPLDRIPLFDRVSIRAVVVEDGEDPGPALAQAGIFEPVALPAVMDEGGPHNSFGDGITPNLVVVLEPDQQEDDRFDAASDADDFRTDPYASAPDANNDSDGSRSGQVGPSRQAAPPSGLGTIQLPATYGMQPLAPVPDPRTRRRSQRPPRPNALAEGAEPPAEG